MKTLSDREQLSDCNEKIYHEEDVKEFIKDLKRNMILQVDIDIIDKLAGDKLIW